MLTPEGLDAQNVVSPPMPGGAQPQQVAAADGAAPCVVTTEDVTLRYMETMQQQQTLMMQMMARLGASGTSTVQAPSWTRNSASTTGIRSGIVDTKGMIKVEDYHGEKEKCLNWKKVLYSAFDNIDESWTRTCREVEQNFKRQLHFNDTRSGGLRMPSICS